MNPEQLQRRVEAGGVTYWELAKLLGVHAHQVNGLSPAALARLPVRLFLALAERLDLDPAELIIGLGPQRSADPHRTPNRSRTRWPTRQDRSRPPGWLRCSTGHWSAPNRPWSKYEPGRR